MNDNDAYINSLNQEYDLLLTGLSPLHGNKVIPKDAVKIVAKNFGNGMGRVIYVDKENRLIRNAMEKL